MPEEAEGTISTFSTFDYDPFDVFSGGEQEGSYMG
jgi:hypothetical protein